MHGFLAGKCPTHGPCCAIVRRFVEGGQLALYVSDAILEEVRDVLGRPRVRAKNRNITDEIVEDFCRRVREIAQRIDPVPASFIFARDPDDEPYLNLALAASADYLVTRDNDMLDLMEDTTFRVAYPALTILDPVALLRILNPSISQP